MLFAVCYGIGFSAFAALIVLVLLNRRPAGFGIWFLIVCILTSVWAASAALQQWWLPGAAHFLESADSAAWLLLIILVLRKGRAREQHWAASQWLSVIALSIGTLAILNDARFVLSNPSPTAFDPTQVLARVIVSVVGILLVENLIRNTPASKKWHVLPLSFAAGGLFAYNLFIFSEAVVLRSISPVLIAGRGIVLALIVPFLVLTMARNPDWRIELHVSRRVVFHTATLTAAGVFLLVAAGIAALIGRIPGQWAAVSEIAFFCGSVGVLVTVLSTESFRARLRRLISENFFSTRYDYRLEWLRCIAALSMPVAEEPLAIRSIRALADVVDSPGGAIWLAGQDGAFRVEHSLNLRMDVAACEPAGGDFVRAFRQGLDVQVFDPREPANEARVPAWARGEPGIWLAVPLVRGNQVFGFVVLAPPRAPVTLNWESFDLLLAIGQQVASYLSEERAARTLLETRALIDYSKKFAFVVHDVKNVAAQLGMMAANIREFGERPEFRADLIRAMESGVERLHNLLDRLRPDTDNRNPDVTADPVQVIEHVVRELDRRGVALQKQIAATDDLRVRMAPENLHSVLTHLVTNAIEASRSGETVIVRLQFSDGVALIEVVDTGHGMDRDFIRDGLFVPFRTTKARGHGVGAYQAREMLRAASGDLEAISELGRGTTMRIKLPCVPAPEPTSELAIAQ